MRLLQLQNNYEFSLTEHIGNDIPPYAILSHTWGADDEEVTFRDLVDGTGSGKVGYRKLNFCGRQAMEDDLQYFWVDTCCIDKSSSAELSEAINSMFRWYYNATKCYVYLSDVSTGGYARDEPFSSQKVWRPLFERSKWFTRGWTLQELLAPTSVEFFSAEGVRLGEKKLMVEEIHDITGINTRALQGNHLRQISIDERMSWAESRQTKREEDAAYSLLGIFDVHMPLLYGEGRKKAFARLRKQIGESLEEESHALSTGKPKQMRNDEKRVPSVQRNVVCFKCVCFQYIPNTADRGANYTPLGLDMATSVVQFNDAGSNVVKDLLQIHESGKDPSNGYASLIPIISNLRVLTTDLNVSFREADPVFPGEESLRTLCYNCYSAAVELTGRLEDILRLEAQDIRKLSAKNTSKPRSFPDILRSMCTWDLEEIEQLHGRLTGYRQQLMLLMLTKFKYVCCKIVIDCSTKLYDSPDLLRPIHSR